MGGLNGYSDVSSANRFRDSVMDWREFLVEGTRERVISYDIGGFSSWTE